MKNMRKLNKDDIEIKDKIKELQLFVADKMSIGKVSDMNMTQLLINDIQLIHHIWTKDGNNL